MRRYYLSSPRTVVQSRLWESAREPFDALQVPKSALDGAGDFAACIQSAVVDAVKGSIVHHTTLPSSAGVCDVKTTITENWLVYSYFDEDFAGVGQSKGYRVVSVGLYDSIDLRRRQSG